MTCVLLSLFKKKTWNVWAEEECVAIKKAFRSYLTHKKLPSRYDILLENIFKEGGVSKLNVKSETKLVNFQINVDITCILSSTLFNTLLSR